MYQLEDLFDSRSVVGAKLEATLAKRSYTKAKFCSVSGISRPTLDKLLSGNLSSKTNFEKHMEKVLKSLAMTPDMLMGNVRNGYNRSRTLRNTLRIKAEEIAVQTGIPLSRLKEIEAGAEATVAELRDIACCLSTSVRSVLGTYYFQTQIAMPQDILNVYQEDASDDKWGFWGHVGILPASSDQYLWFPITGNTRKLIYQMAEKDRMVVPCMNNKLLLINIQNIDRIVLLDDACDAPGFGNWDPAVDCGAIPLVVYEALDDYLYYKNEGRIPPADIISPAFLNLIESLLNENKLDVDKLDSSEGMTIYYTGNKVNQTDIDFESEETITEEISSLYEFNASSLDGKFLFYQDDNGAEFFLNFDHVAVIELPLLKTEDAICRAQEEMTAETCAPSSF